LRKGTLAVLPVFRFLAIVFGALALTMTSAHVLEMPQKMQYSAGMYSAVNTSLYRYFAIVGGAYQMAGIVSAVVLATLLRRRAVFRWALAGAVLLALAFVSWLALVAPVNRQIAAALASAPDSVPALWTQLRGRWEYGHATGFALHLLGFCAVVVAVVREASAGPGTA
jgi:hypothetical protein